MWCTPSLHGAIIAKVDRNLNAATRLTKCARETLSVPVTTGPPRASTAGKDGGAEGDGEAGGGVDRLVALGGGGFDVEPIDELQHRYGWCSGVE